MSLMSEAPSHPSFSLIVAAVVLAFAGWAGVVYLATQTLPTVGPQWMFFAVWLMALTGTAIPFVHYLNRRFAHGLPPDTVMLRQSIWVGIFGATCAWLQLGRALTWASALLLAAALVAIEGFLILRERSKRPFDDSSPTAKR
jgi:drug/metabolite transporter (DMT)-like permease